VVQNSTVLRFVKLTQFCRWASDSLVWYSTIADRRLTYTPVDRVMCLRYAAQMRSEVTWTSKSRGTSCKHDGYSIENYVKWGVKLCSWIVTVWVLSLMMATRWHDDAEMQSR